MKFYDYEQRKSIPVEGARKVIINKVEGKTRKEVLKRLNSILDDATAAFTDGGYDGRYRAHRNWRKELSELVGHIPMLYRTIENAVRRMSDEDNDGVDFGTLDQDITCDLECRIDTIFKTIDSGENSK